ncbi:MAG: hypothetical protein CM15mP74_09580 [Halieaceae bacterium]|nr:MAG: hypothetical protein CM15mP74_09580 [Halieaceae bacterium]
MCMYSATDGLPDDWHLVHYGSLAKGGAALVYTEMTNVSADGRITPGALDLERHTPRLAAHHRFRSSTYPSQNGDSDRSCGPKGSTWNRGNGTRKSSTSPSEEEQWPLLRQRSALRHLQPPPRA